MNKPGEEGTDSPQPFEREDADKYDDEDCRPLRTAEEIGIRLSPEFEARFRGDVSLPQSPVPGEKNPVGLMDQRSTIDHQRIAEAFTYAAEIHANQVRKGTDIAYISHLMSVSALVIEHGGDTDQAIAGLLHDSLEDCGPEHGPIILERFGDRVYCIVLACTDGVPDANGHKGDWRQRKQDYLAHLETADEGILLVSASDKLHNARSIVSDLQAIGLDVFTRFKAGREGTLWYYDSLAHLFAARLPGALSSELVRTTEAMHRLAG